MITELRHQLTALVLQRNEAINRAKELSDAVLALEARINASIPPLDKWNDLIVKHVGHLRDNPTKVNEIAHRLEQRFNRNALRVEDLSSIKDIIDQLVLPINIASLKDAARRMGRVDFSIGDDD